MNGFDTFLLQYGPIAIFIVMFVKSAGVPIPIPGDLIILTAAAHAAAHQSLLELFVAFIVILVAVVLGGMIQFSLVRGPARGLLYRFGRYIGLTEARLDAASARVKKGGIVSVSLAILVPGVRATAVTASGLANIPLRTFVPGLIIGSTLFLILHLFIGYTGGALLTTLANALPLPQLIAVGLLLLAFGVWFFAFRRQSKKIKSEANAESLEVWNEGICPVCLALYTANQLRAPVLA
jgi:membrane protein DedA with SNARE-associated domain